MGKAVKALVGILVFAAAAGAAEDTIKWEVSKQITYFPPDTAPGNFGKDYSHLRPKYVLEWAPAIHADIDRIRVYFDNWECCATGLNGQLEYGGMPRNDYDTAVKKENDWRNRYLDFVVTVICKNEDFYKSSTEEFWRFYLITENDEIEPYNVNGRGGIKGKTWAGKISAAPTDVWIEEQLFTNTFYVTFENPYGNETPTSLKLVLEGGDVKRGFEWRFKEDK